MNDRFPRKRTFWSAILGENEGLLSARSSRSIICELDRTRLFDQNESLSIDER
jgi:hypothetical protein